MNKQTFDINRLRVAAPCSVPWESMSGDERVRRCNSCELNIYNTAEMTEKEVADLIANREERLCIRLYKRADGTVLTKDCPVGLSAYRKRVARLAGAALTALLGLFSVSYGQKGDRKTIDASRVKIVRTSVQDQKSTIGGVISDPNGAVIPNAKIVLYQKSDKKKRFETVSDSNGEYTSEPLPAGKYILEASVPGFKRHRIVNLEIKDGEKLEMDLILEINGDEVTVGLFLDTDPATTIDPGSSSVKTTITKKMMEKQPWVSTVTSKNEQTNFRCQ